MPPGDVLLGPGGFPAWLALAALGGVLAMDGISWPQAMVSRPLVAGTLGGLAGGDAAAGLLVGAVLEVLFLRYPPFGAARYPDGGPAGLVAGVAFALAGEGSPTGLAAATAAGWTAGWMGSASVQLLRRINERLVGRPERLAGDGRRLEIRHRIGIRLDFARGVLLTAGLLVPAVLFVRVAAAPPGGGSSAAAVLPLTIAVALSAGAAARSLPDGGRGRLLLFAGLAAGATFVAVFA
ncbi:MAG: PTS sugar transporter subunit IIC [Gemmatimonadota bacterium]|nr:PTS sugar transporter subunit IIC [Gemmatimonadota bacterium]